MTLHISGTSLMIRIFLEWNPFARRWIVVVFFFHDQKRHVTFRMVEGGISFEFLPRQEQRTKHRSFPSVACSNRYWLENQARRIIKKSVTGRPDDNEPATTILLLIHESDFGAGLNFIAGVNDDLITLLEALADLCVRFVF